MNDVESRKRTGQCVTRSIEATPDERYPGFGRQGVRECVMKQSRLVVSVCVECREW